MANTITTFKKYTDKLDEVYKSGSCFGVLDGDTTLIQMGANAGELLIPKIDMDGMGDYSRSGGYADGNVSLTMQTKKFDYDRGRKFTVDAMDNEETAGVAFGRLAGEFVRVKATPELDAYRAAKYSEITGIQKASGALTDGAGILNAINAANIALDEAEVPLEDRYLFITPTLLNTAQNVTLNDSGKKAVLDSFARIIKVPQSRFYTSINLLDGKSSGEEIGGFAPAVGGFPINFMIISKSAVLQYTKHGVNKVVRPEDNQSSDGYMFFYRSYGLAEVFDNKVKGIYLHRGTTAVTA
jgi:hypothetical protein